MTVCKIDKEVYVCLVSAQKVIPRLVIWNKREYKIKTVGYHHIEKRGATLYHIFSVYDGNTSFKLELNGTDLKWKLLETSDGLQ
jgi:hypothetical protein